MEKFYTSQEAAQVLSVCIDTVRRYLRAGKLHGRRLGKGYRIPESELLRLLRAEESG